ncbi:unnamed protein product, partial [Linum tenue]
RVELASTNRTGRNKGTLRAQHRSFWVALSGAHQMYVVPIKDLESGLLQALMKTTFHCFQKLQLIELNVISDSSTVGISLYLLIHCFHKLQSAELVLRDAKLLLSQ